MATKLTRFVIQRRDLGATELVLELDGLSIGSSLDSDLLLNHPTVSRTHAGIREINGAFWITNLSKTNGTLVDGKLIETVQLEPDDFIRIGVFVLRPAMKSGELTLEIERYVDAYAAEERGTQLLTDSATASDGKGGTMFLPNLLSEFLKSAGGTGALERPGTAKLPPLSAITGKLSGDEDEDQETVLRSATQLLKQGGRLQRGMTGNLLNSIVALPEEDQQRFVQAMNVFWKRREEAKTGAQKLDDAKALEPREPDPELAKYNLHLGKKRFNWLPTNDLVRPWPRGYLYVFGTLMMLASIVAYFVWERAYVPGDTSNPHALNLATLKTREPLTARRVEQKLVADRPAENQCNACHVIGASMQAKCVDCHNTQHFNTSVIEKHEQAKIQCVDCHTEHKGADFRPGVVSRSMCIDCHRNNPTHPKALSLTDGKPLKEPHNGTFGYPVVDDKWTWTDPMNKKWVKTFAESKEPLDASTKFHVIHAAAAPSTSAWKCSECHDGSFQKSLKEVKIINRDKCATCHGQTFATAASLRAQDIDSRRLGIDCNSCHGQHPESQTLVAALRRFGSDDTRKRDAVIFTKDGVYRGGKDWQWTSFAANFGGFTLAGWGLFLSLIPITGIGFLTFDTIRKRRLQNALKGKILDLANRHKKFTDTKYADRWESETQKTRAKETSQAHPVPHPVINYETCIGCHACILACPQDVLGFDDHEHHAIVVNLEQCMEDTGCQQACPTVPQSCVLINTKQNIREAPKPLRKGLNEGFETESVTGVYLVGDVSGVPLIRNAIKEGRLCLDRVAEKIKEEGPVPGAEYDVAIIGIGPGGISATARAAELGLSYVALEQGRKYATIADKYPAGKYVAFNPFNPGDPELGAVRLEGAGDIKEKMLGWWDEAVTKLGLAINEFEGCKEIVKETGYFVVKTGKKPEGYKVRKVVLAIGNAGEARKLGCPGEVEGRVQYRLQDPGAYQDKDIIVVGAGNSAVEAAVDLTGKRQPDGTVIFPETGANRVTLVVRSDFPKDLTLENKMWIYYCMDAGRVKAYFGAGVREITEKEVTLEKIRDKSLVATVPNDVVFAMIGSIAPKEFLTKIGIKYAGDDKKKEEKKDDKKSDKKK
jgi:thioredoxin reductase/NAD-dependent dihydropyrimidine dehydrogenase PreA subunit